MLGAGSRLGLGWSRKVDAQQKGKQEQDVPGLLGSRDSIWDRGSVPRSGERLRHLLLLTG